MSVVGWRGRVRGICAENSSGLYWGFDGTGVDVWCRCGHLLLGRPLTPGEMNVVGRSDLDYYAYVKYVQTELGHFTYVLAELGHFTCPVCGYSWEDARELFRGVWD